MSDKNAGGSELAEVIKASLSKEAQDLQGELGQVTAGSSKFYKALADAWPAFYKEKAEDNGFVDQVKAAQKAISGNKLDEARAAIAKSKILFDTIKSDVEKLQAASDKWTKLLSANTATPTYVAELEASSQKLHTINEACKSAYFDALKKLTTRGKTPNLSKPLKSEIDLAISELTSLRKAVDTAYSQAKDVYPGELLDLLTSDATVTGSYQWFEEKKDALDAQASKGIPPTKVPEVVDPAKQAELDWMAVRADVNKKYKEFKQGAANATLALPEWHRLRGPYMENGLMTTAVASTYFVLSEQHTIGGLTYTVSDSHTAGLSLKTPLPTVFRRDGAPNARSFIYHRTV